LCLGLDGEPPGDGLCPWKAVAAAAGGRDEGREIAGHTTLCNLLLLLNITYSVVILISKYTIFDFEEF
jgi:hypothetical protein